MNREWPTPDHPHVSTEETLNLLLIDIAEEAGHPDPVLWAGMMTGTLIALIRKMGHITGEGA